LIIAGAYTFEMGGGEKRKLVFYFELQIFNKKFKTVRLEADILHNDSYGYAIGGARK
jgi:hypothetical protein